MMTTPDLAFAAAASVLLLGSILSRIFLGKKAIFAFNIAMLVLVSAMLLALSTASAHTVAGLFSINPFSIFFMLLFTAGMALVNLLAYQYSEQYGDFAVLSNFALMGMYLIALSNSLITIFIGLELASLPAVFIILLSKRSIESATKFFIMTSIAIAVFSLAMALYYGASGGLVLGSSGTGELLAAAAILFIAALGIDASIFPFNLLVPDVYQGAPAYVTSMLGGINKKVALAALMQIVILSFISFRSAFEILAVLSVITMFYGNIVAMMQSSLKRMLAYSSISQAGYILIGMATASASGISASLFQIFAHTFAFIGLFGIISWMESRNRTRVEDLNGLSSENRLAAFALVIFILSFVGMPLTTGFVGKFLLFLSAVNSGLLWLAMLGILNSVISIYYYSKPIMAAYAPKHGARRLRMNIPVLIIVILALSVTIILGVYPQPLIRMTSSAAGYLFGP